MAAVNAVSGSGHDTGCMKTPDTSFRSVALVAVLLLVLTSLSTWFATGQVHLPVSVGTAALGFAWIKGWLIADHFMELREAPWLLRGVVLGWLTVVCVGLMWAL